MPPSSDGIRTVGCRLDRLVLDDGHLQAIRHAVNRVHKATILVTELLNMHIRRCLELRIPIDEHIFQGNWIMKAYYLVTIGGREPIHDSALQATCVAYMPTFDPPRRDGLTQVLKYDADNLGTVGKTNVWKHFHSRIFRYVRHMAPDKMSRATRLKLAADLLRPPSDSCILPDYKDWVQEHRTRIGIDSAVGEWKGKPLLYHLKAAPHRFLLPMAIISNMVENVGGKGFSLFPLRRTLVPRHIHFCKKAFHDVLQADYNCRFGRKRKRENKDEDNFSFESALDARAAGLRQKWRLKGGFTTDGVCARLYQNIAKKNSGTILENAPTRGKWTIDELKHVSRQQDWQIVGVDPGKRELIVAVDNETGKTVRYTQVQRQRETRTWQYAREAKFGMPTEVKNGQRTLASYNSKTASLHGFCAYCAAKHTTLEESLSFYGELEHRKRRWKSSIKKQQSEEKVYSRLREMQSGKRPLLLAYGSWGLVAGRVGACNKGNAPCIGIGLLRKLSQRFVVAITPEAYTSKTCNACGSMCGPWKELETKRGKKIRGVRRCQNENCMLPLNRDRNAAKNIGTQCRRLLDGEGPLRTMSKEDEALQQLSLCFDCE